MVSKRRLTLIALLLTFVCSLVSFSACANNEHVHNFSSDWTKDSSYHQQVCAGCEEVRNKAEHDWNMGVVTSQPTETREGEKTFTCNTCGHTKVESVPMLDHHVHTYSNAWSFDASSHWHSATCEHTDEKKDVTAHDWNLGVVTSQPTETSEGEKTFTCNTCGHTKIESIPMLERHVHTYSDAWAFDASSHWHSATCEHTDEKKDVTAHDWNLGVETLQPTEMREGEKTFTCNTCGHTKIESIPKLKPHVHTFADVWTMDETHHWRKSTCEHTDERRDYAPHAWNVGEITTQPTETQDGVKTFTCLTCPKTRTEAVPALGESHTHEYNQQVTTDKYVKDRATCVQKAVYYYSCFCGDRGTETFVFGDFANHKYDTDNISWVWNGYESATAMVVCLTNLQHTRQIDANITGEVTDVPNCVKAGAKTYTATIILDGISFAVTKNEILKPFGHNEVIDQAVASTCQKTGLTEGVHCSVCKEVLTAQTETGKAKHTEEKIDAVASTCFAEGKTEGKKCSVCGEILVEPQPTEKAAHTQEKILAVAPTCENTGLTEGVRCSVCSEILTAQTEVSAKGHKFDTANIVWTWNGYEQATATMRCANDSTHEKTINANITDKVTMFATCTTSGEKIYTATITVEGKAYTSTKSETLANLGHTRVVDEAVEPTCEKTGLTEGAHCSVCSEVLTAQTEVSAKGHKFDTANIVWTWNGYEQATATMHCANDSTHEKTINANITDKVTTFATCTTSGEKIYTATITVEGKAYTSTKSETLANLGHTRVVDEAVEPTCETTGLTAGAHCSVCSEVLTAQTEVSAKGHKFDTANIVWTWNGYEQATATMHCANDSAHEKTINANITDKITNGATCTTAGEKTYTATITVDGKAYTSTKSETLANLGHTRVVDEAVEPTCEKTGLTAGAHCSVCSEILTAQTELPKADHVEVIDKGYDSTCKVQGLSDGKHCLICGFVMAEQTKLPLSTHTIVIDQAVAPSCETTGLSQGSHCSSCGTILVEQTILFATHDFGSIELVYNGSNIDKVIVPCKKCDEYKTATDLYAEYVGGEVFVGNYASKSNVKVYLILDYSEQLAVDNFTVDTLKISQCGANYFNVNCYNLKTTLSINGYIAETSPSYFTYTTSKEKVTITAYTGNASAVRIPNTIDGYPVVAIAKEAFKGNLSIKSVMLAENVQTIGSNAFSGCTLLETIVLNEGLTTIGYNAFANTAITELIIPDSVTTIQNDGNSYNYSMVEGCQKLKRVVIGDGLTTLTVYLFQGLQSLEEVEIGSNVMTIGSHAFDGCISLESITIPNSVTTINGYAFRGCTNLKNITWSNQLSVIGSYSFSGCTSLTSVKLPNSVKTIGSNAFSGCTLLETIVLNEGLTTIGYNAFANTAITELVIPDSVTTIQNDGNSYNYSMVEGCQKLKRVVIGDGLTTLTVYLFQGLQSLEEVEIGSNVMTIGSYAFDGCISLESITIPNSVTTINGYAFRGCTNLKNITWSNQLSVIGSYSFSGCTSLTSVKLPNSVKTIGSNAFSGCTLLETIVLNEGLTTIGYNAFANTAITELVIPDSVTTIQNDGNSYNYSMVEGCQKLKRVVIGDGLTTLTVYLFQGLQSLEEVEIGSNVMTIGSYAFDGCISLESITIPNSVTTINSYAFYGCTNLKNIIWSNQLSVIGSDAFKGCTSLTSVKLPNSVKTIYNEAFSGCTLLETIVLNEGLTTIDYNAFANTAITELIIPDSVTTIQNDGNSYNYSMVEGCQKLKRVVIGDGLTTLTKYLFQGLQSLEEVEIGSNVMTIGSYAFDGCISLENITIPNSVTTINSYAFRNSGLRNVKIPKNVNSIGDYAFSGCAKLEYLLIDGTALTKIGKNVTSGCTSARRIFYKGSITDWNAISINSTNSRPFDQVPYIYSASRPTQEGNYWYYSANGEPVVWDITLSEYKVYAMSNAYNGTMGSNLLSCSSNYLQEMKDDTDFMARKSVYEAAVLIGDLGAGLEAELSKDQLYIIVLLDILGYNHVSDAETPEIIDTLLSCGSFIGNTIDVTGKFIKKASFENFASKIGVMGTTLDVAFDIIETSGNAKVAAQYLLGFALQCQNSIDILTRIANDTSNNKDLRNAANAVINILKKSYNGTISGLVAQNMGIETAKNFGSLALSYIWDTTCSYWLPLKVTQLLAQGVTLSLDLFGNTGESVDAYYKLEVTCIIENALREQINSLDVDYLRRENLESSTLIYTVVNLYRTAILKGYEYTLSYLDSMKKDSTYVRAVYEQNVTAFKQFETEVEDTYYTLYSY